MRALCLTVCFATAFRFAPAQPLDPLAVDSQHYHLELENQWVRVIREQMGPHERMPMHQHPGPGAVIVFLTDRHNRLIGPDGSRRELRDHSGDVMLVSGEHASQRESE